MKRDAFGLVFAIIILVVVATLGIFGLKLSTKTLNSTTNEHISIQLNLYLESTIELAILYIQRNGFKFVEGSNTQIRPNVMAPITKTITYGANDEYVFTYKMTPLINIDDPSSKDSNEIKQTKVNTMVIDVSGYVVSPVTNQTFRVTKRQIVKP